MIFRLAIRELFRNKKFLLFFALNLSLGLTGFVALESFKSALVGHMNSNAKNILTADIEVSARRALTDEELKLTREILVGSEESQSYSFFAMLSHGNQSRLVEVNSLDEKYPLHGYLDLDSGKSIRSQSSKNDLANNNIWVYPEVVTQGKLKKNDTVKLGNLSLKISDIVTKDSSQTFRGAAFAPSVFIHADLIEKSGLIKFGSTYSNKYFFKLPPGVDAQKVKEQLYEKLTDSAVQVESWQGAGEDAGRQLGYLSDFLGLVSLVALFMSALGAAYIYRLYLGGRLKEIAIYRSLGLQAKDAVGIYLFQAVIMGLCAALPSLLISQLFLPWLGSLLSQFLPFVLSVNLSFEVVLITLLMGVLGSLSLSLPFMSRIYDLRPASLFSEEKFNAEISLKNWYWYLPAIIFFTMLSVYQANSVKVGLMFVLGLIVVMILTAFFVLLKILFISKLGFFKSWELKYSLLGLSRRKASTAALSVALGLGALLINILPQLKLSLQNEFSYSGSAKLPSLFLFDIQDEQIPALDDILKQASVKKVSSSALVRSRILKINDVDYERKVSKDGFKTREEERETRMRNRGVNLSYREALSESEEIVAGEPIQTVFDSSKGLPAKLSVEERFAERMGFKLNDRILFDIQGVEVEGIVENFRKVKWASFQPNFFILVQSGVLEEAPKTHIMALPSMSPELKDQMQYQISEKLGNISIIDVSRLVQEILKVAEQMSWSLELMAGLALLTGYVVLFSIVRSQVTNRRWEVNMMKVLGASSSKLLIFLVAEGFWVALISSSLGTIISIFASWFLSWYLFDGNFTFSLFWPFVSIFGIICLSVIVSVFAIFDILKEKPIVILREEVN